MNEKLIEKWIELISENPQELKNAPLNIRNEKSVVKAAICRPFDQLIEINHDGITSFFKTLSVFEFVGPELRNNIEYIKELIPICSGYLFKYLDQNLRNNSELFLFALEYASKKYIKEMAEKSIDESSHFNNFWEIIPRPEFECQLEHSCILNDSDSDLSLSFLSDKNTLLQAFEYQPIIYSHLNDSLKLDREIALKAVALYYGNFPFAPKELKGDLEFVITYLKNDADGESFYSRNFDPIFWYEIDEKLIESKSLYLSMIHEIKFMDLKDLIITNAPKHIQNDVFILEYLNAKHRIT
jgi:hypothetical protein